MTGSSNQSPPYRPSTNRRVTLRFAWYDLWIGAFYDRTNRVLYVCPLPCVLLTLPRRQPKGEPFPPEWEQALTDWQQEQPPPAPPRRSHYATGWTDEE